MICQFQAVKTKKRVLPLIQFMMMSQDKRLEAVFIINTILLQQADTCVRH